MRNSLGSLNGIGMKMGYFERNKNDYYRAAIITDSQDAVFRRKRGLNTFMQPGGKPEIGETRKWR